MRWLGVTLLAAVAYPAAGLSQTVPRGVDPDIPLAQLVLRHWTTDEGLPTNVLLSVQQTAAGDLWISGFGGLARFDGIEFEVFTQDTVPALTASSFYGLVEDGNRLWIATQDKGVWKFEDGRLAPLAAEQTLTSVRALQVDRSGVLWVGTANQGALRVEQKRLVPVDHPDLTAIPVRAVFEDRHGVLWFGTEGRGLIRLTDGRYETVGPATGLADASVTSLSEAAAGGLWIGTQGGLYRYLDGATGKSPQLEGVEIFGLAEDDYGSLWVAAEQGLFRRRAGSDRFEHLTSLDGRSLHSVNSLAFDHEGSVWISSYTSGLYQLRAGKFRNFTRASGLSSERVNSLYERSDGSILVGGDLGAVDVIADGGVSRFTSGTGLPEVRVRAFLEDSRGDLWISSYAGLLRLRDGEETLFTTASGLPTNQVRLVYEDSSGRLWAATRGGGLVRVAEGGGFEAFGVADGLPSDFVLSIAEDAAGNLLVGTQEGLAVLAADGEVTSYQAEAGLPGSLVFNASVDDEGVIWLCTTGGLARMRDGEIAALTAQNGLPADAVYDYREDDRGYAWMSSNKGVVRVKKSELVAFLDGEREILEPDLLDEADGMAESQCTGATHMHLASDGRLWVPTLGGVSVIDPYHVPSNPVPPPVLIRRLTIDGREVAPPAASDAAIDVPPGRRRFEFSFAALSFQAPEKVVVRYRLEGFDEHWLDAGRERKALYTGLPPGAFSFRVIAANNDGVWNSREAVLRVRVRPRFYQTPAFLLLVAGALIAGPWTVYRWRVAVVSRRSLMLEKLLVEQRRLEHERTQLIRKLEMRNEQLEHLTYSISHDLKSPVFTIQGFLGLLEKDRRAGDEQRMEENLKRIREAAEAMSRLLDQLHKLWRMESRESRFERTDLGELARQAVAAVQGRLTDRKVEILISPQLPRVLADPTQIMEVLQNLIDNAARFMGEQSRPRVEVGCRLDGEEQVIFVRDNGIGIDPQFHDKVFRIFEKLDSAADGTGLGLAIAKRVIEAHGGRIWVESDGGGNGSTFCFTLGQPPPAGTRAS